MVLRPHEDDIPTGKSSWIEFIDLEGRQDQAVEVDHLLADLLPLLQALELHCVAACCGFNAFDFYPDTIASAVAEMNLKDLHEALNKAIHDVKALDTTIIMSTRMNNYADKKTFMELLMHIQSCVPSE